MALILRHSDRRSYVKVNTQKWLYHNQLTVNQSSFLCETQRWLVSYLTTLSNIHCIQQIHWRCLCLMTSELPMGLLADFRAEPNQYFAKESKQNWGADKELPSDQSSYCALFVLLSDFAPLGLLAHLKLTSMRSETYRVCFNLSVCLTLWNTVWVYDCCVCFGLWFHI